jgi:hypothetical protein
MGEKDEDGEAKTGHVAMTIHGGRRGDEVELLWEGRHGLLPLRQAQYACTLQEVAP